MRLALVAAVLSAIPVAGQVSFSGGQRALGQPMSAQRMSNGSLQQQQQQQAQQPTGKSSISGNVINDVSKEPVNKARVALSGAVNLNAVTDAAGHFGFNSLPSGTYRLQVQNDRPGAQRLRLDALVRSKVTLAEDESKSGVVLIVTPPASISGHLADEEGQPLSNCNVMAMQFDFSQGSRTLGLRGGASTDGKGEYRIAELPAGKYFLRAQCRQAIPLPHAFVRRNSGVEVPMLSYTAQFYPGTPDMQAAAKVSAAGGSEVSGMDFRLAAGGGVTVRGKTVSAEPAALSGMLQVMLEPRDPLQRPLGVMGARVNRQTGDFRFENVTPGSYNVTGMSFVENKRYFATASVEVGSSPPEPFAVTLAPATTLTGAITQEGETSSSLEAAQVGLFPLDRFSGAPPPNSPVQKDGTFSLNGVVPGRWKLNVTNLPGYIKSISLNNRETTSSILDIPEGAAGPLRIVVSSAWAQVDGTVSGLSAEAGQVYGLLWRVGETSASNAPGQVLGVDAQGKFTASNVQPGKYLACAAGVEPWMLMQNPEAMEAIKSHCETLEAAPAGRATVQIRLIPAKDLETILAGLDN